jgi:hypothetical protein
MKILLIVLLTFGTFSLSLAQEDSSLRVALTKENLQKAIEWKSYQSSEMVNLVSCNDDSSYYKADTIRLCTKGYEDDCCHKVEWVFLTRTDFYYMSIHVCEEGPKARNSESFYRISLAHRKGKLYLEVFKDKQMKEVFLVSTIDRIDRHWDESLLDTNVGYVITMVRQ